VVDGRENEERPHEGDKTDRLRYLRLPLRVACQGLRYRIEPGNEVSKFRKVKPLYITSFQDEVCAEVDHHADRKYIWINMENMGIDIKTARALRDWLIAALPKSEK